MRRSAMLCLLCSGLWLATAGRAAGQERSVALGANYPWTVGDTFLSRYEGAVGFGVAYGQPLSARWRLRPALTYERLHAGQAASTTARVYTAQLGLAYAIPLTKALALMPEAGAGYTHIGFRVEGGPLLDGGAGEERIFTANDGFSAWVAFHPTYRVGAGIGLSATLGYRATFLEAPTYVANTPYNRQLHALVLGTALAYHF